ncbi:hypothetical protein IID22_03100 [Patescibacteria group bacterium]|nr:hypothetical protein [Patescibacteria group bacterium]
MSKEFRLSNDEECLRNAINTLNARLRIDGVGFDIDGVEVDSATPAIERFNKLHDKLYTKKDLISVWEMANWARQIPGIDDPKGHAISVWNNDEVFANAHPEQGAWILAQFLYQEGVYPHRITSRPSYNEDVTRSWYSKNTPWVEQSFIHVQSKGFEISQTFKVDKINEKEIRYFFEDDIESAEMIVLQTQARVIIVPQPWNRFYEPSSDQIIKVRGYSEFPRLIRSYLTLAEGFII